MLPDDVSFDRPGNEISVKQYNSVIGQAEFKFFITPNPGDQDSGASLLLSSIAVGYTRDFEASYLASYYGSDRGYLKFYYFFSGRALLTLEGGLGAIERTGFQVVVVDLVSVGLGLKVAHQAEFSYLSSMFHCPGNVIFIESVFGVNRAADVARSQMGACTLLHSLSVVKLLASGCIRRIIRVEIEIFIETDRQF